MENKQQLNQFLHGEQSKAYCLAMRSLHNRDDALDAVQDAMFKLVDHYADKPLHELAPLFYRILFNRIKDTQRKGNRFNQLFSGMFVKRSKQSPNETINDFETVNYEDTVSISASKSLDDAALKRRIDHALNDLPERQRQAFVLRAWLEMDVKQTAAIMSCSEGSVKTHFSRARHSLKENLADLYELLSNSPTPSKPVNPELATIAKS